MLSLDQDGDLSEIGSTSWQPSISVTADALGNAFALYRAPLDFVRQSYANDATALARTVHLSVQSGANPGLTNDTSITVLRPPVVLVHGLWDGQDAWQQFSPLIDDGRFRIYKVDYNHPVHIMSSTPSYSPSTLAKAGTSALGFDFNWSDVLQQIQSFIADDFKSGMNPLGIPIAAVQADIVAHSMGGDIARYLRLKSGYLDDANYDASPIHKLITIGTPHLGTPLASQLLDPANSCVANLFAAQNLLTFNSVAVANQLFDGAVFDLEPLSSAIASLGLSSAPPIPTALIGGDMTTSQLSGITCTFCVAALIRQVCGGGRHPDPLAVNFTFQSFRSLVGGDSDGIVPLTSALDGFAPGSPFITVFPAVHSGGAVSLDFNPPTLLDGVFNTPQSNLPNQAINLLNAATTSSNFTSLP
jgi:pimeloyl-ACP methyl ester carboxylesterase